eukprot:1160898-Pelagomonas_calceolata.AAC.5
MALLISKRDSFPMCASKAIPSLLLQQDLQSPCCSHLKAKWYSFVHYLVSTSLLLQQNLQSPCFLTPKPHGFPLCAH